MYPFREGSFAVRNAWYVAAFARDVGRALVSRIILNQPVVLYRKEDGVAVAVGGRCPHRHFPLGASCLRGDTIVCGYHGIAFGADGACVDIPAQAHVPRSYRIPTYPLVEHGMWLWIWMGDAAANPALLPDLDDIGFTTPGLYPEPLFTHEVACRYQLLNDNLLDLSHLAFLHSSSIGTIENARTPETVTQEPRVLRSRRYIRDCEPTPAMARRGVTGLVDQVVGMDFHLPGLHAGIGDHFVATGDAESWGEPLARSRPFHAITPSTPTSTYYFFGIATMDPDHAERSAKFLAPVIDEDIFASVEIEKMIALVGGNPPELMIKSDHNAVLGRRMLQAMMDAEAREAATA
ncbi:Rieske 2Fe-2S domain-containing protein [Sphingomonas baiyangensis]|uniref:Iron-sulfur protein n=1 Tax=Sphingomonas baiyangensis TaxID=2572576 RepID=A0A4U1L371_9SPHN|nr:Rieske 2Fe-2S domain-containing protein [Sphingomonas baiyangensis]TKD50670.1 iron-sulfur protein [Sphingomonas baiyangensis]